MIKDLSTTIEHAINTLVDF